MPRPTRFALMAIVAAAACLPLLTVHHARAHAVVTAGSRTLAIGWLREPAYVGVDNAVQVLVKDATGTPATGLTDRDLQVEVSLGSQKLPVRPLVPSFDADIGLGVPGEYEFHVIPTAPGKYTFHVVGRLPGGTAVDSTVTAGDTTFAEVTDQASADFPIRVPALADVSRKADALGARIEAAQQVAVSATSATVDAKRSADRATVLAVLALVLGVLLGGAGVASAVAARRR